MPIEDADKVNSKRGSEGSLFTIFGYKITLMKLLMIVGGGVGGIFLIIAASMMMTPAPPPVIVTPTPVIPTINMSLTVISTNYSYRILQINYTGTKSITNFNKEVIFSMYPPANTPYVQRQAIINNDVSKLTNPITFYMYTGIDNSFYISNTIPNYENCIDFMNGDWTVNIDDGITRTNLYKFKFTITNSKTKIISNGSQITNYINNASDLSTLFINSGLYKERIVLDKTIRLIGIGNPTVDAGGYGADITVKSNNNVITGLTLTNSGIKNYTDGGIVVMVGSNGNTITKNNIYKTIHGIWIQGNSNIIANNTIHDNDYTGIILLKASSNIITNNIIYNNINGIHVDSVSDSNTIRENTVTGNRRYGVIIDNYKNLHNICEYNIYKSVNMSCSDSVDRNQQVTPVQSSSALPSVITTEPTVDNWAACEKGDKKCYQS